MQPTYTKEKTGQTIPIVQCGVGYYFRQTAGAAGKWNWIELKIVITSMKKSKSAEPWTSASDLNNNRILY